MNPGEVVDFLNDYFSEMVDAVFEFGGVLDKYIGDGMMALFGSLDDAPDHACRAVRTALRMKTHLESLNAERVKAGKPEIRIGIGIHTDVVVVGSIGSRHRLEYTAVGDGVNTASRLEGLNKQFGTTILISGNTHQATCQEFDCRSMPDAVLKGKSRTVTIYEVVGAIASKMQGDLKQQVEGQAVLSVKGTDERP
jgi:adenylate cyclase